MSESLKRKLLFACLYLSEGAPIGFIWLALPTRLRIREVPIEQITTLSAMLVLPWTFKFVWAPAIDVLRGKRWHLRSWIITTQLLMSLTLLPLLWLDPVHQFQWVAIVLLMHAFSAATQDVSIDAYCIATTSPGERGAYNGWMQTGMMTGRAMMGGGALMMSKHFGDSFVVVLLVALTSFSLFLVWLWPQQEILPQAAGHFERVISIWRSLLSSVSQRNTWLGLVFGLMGGAAFKSLEVFYGPYLVDRGVSQDVIGLFSMVPVIGMMIIGSILGGFLADRVGVRVTVSSSLAMMSLAIILLGIADYTLEIPVAYYAFPLLAFIAFCIGYFTASSYALFMDLTQPRIAATQFSAFMGSTNGCESWTGFASGLIIANYGYPAAMCAMAGVSLLTLPVFFLMRPVKHGVDKSKVDKGKG